MKATLGEYAEAMGLFADGLVPRDREERCSVLFSFEQRQPDFLPGLDKLYYRDVDALGGTPHEDVNHLQVQFLRKNAREPVLAPLASAEFGRLLMEER